MGRRKKTAVDGESDSAGTGKGGGRRKTRQHDPKGAAELAMPAVAAGDKKAAVDLKHALTVLPDDTIFGTSPALNAQVRNTVLRVIQDNDTPPRVRARMSEVYCRMAAIDAAYRESQGGPPEPPLVEPESPVIDVTAVDVARAMLDERRREAESGGAGE